MRKKEIKSELKILDFIIFIPFGILALVGAYFLISNSLDDEYPKILFLGVGIFFGLIGLASLLIIFLFEKNILKDDKLIILSITGREKKIIKLSEIVSYYEIEKEGRSNSWKDLTIFTKDSKYTISSAIYSNYDEFRKKLTRGKKKNIKARKLLEYRMNRRYGIGFLIVGTIFTLFLGSMFLNRNNEILPIDLSQIEGTVANEIKVKKSGKRNELLSIPIELKEYPKFKFKTNGYGFRSIKTNQLISNVKKGDRIQVDILTEQYKKKLTKEIQMNFWDRGFSYREIVIYGLRDNADDYFNLSFYNKLKSSDRNSIGMYVLLGFSLFLLGYGIKEILTNKKPILKTDKNSISS